MADNTHIEWTDATWQPITGCSVVSPGCTNCYAMKLAGTRLADHPSRAGLTTPSKAGPVWNGQVRLNEAWLTQPLRWKRPRRIFVCAHGDLFHEAVPDAWIDLVFAVMALSPQHTFQVLTKRAARMRAYLTDTPLCRRRWETAAVAAFPHIEHRAYGIPPVLPNVWLGVSTEDQVRADERIPHLLATPAAVRFVSAEPLLGPIDFRRWLAIDWQCSRCRGFFSGRHRPSCPSCGAFGGWSGSHEFNGRRYPTNQGVPARRGSALDLIIGGGESGPGARPMHPDWARQIRDDCAAAGVPFFFKQWGAWGPDHGDGGLASLNRFLAARTAHLVDGDWRYDMWASDPGRRFDADVFMVGKKVAGRLLDDVEHNAMPEGRP